jgi:hypothetical protein
MEDSMPRKILLVVAVLALLAAVSASRASGQSNATKIATALSAAPASIAAHATVMDYPGKDGKMATLKAGNNGWVCLPSHPQSKYLVNDAMCVDHTWMGWFGNLMAKKKSPEVKQVGYSYMLSANDWESNTDGDATAPTPTNEWHHVHPHMMIIYPDPKMLEGLPITPSTNGAYVMWPGSPYAHVMIPVK